MIGEVAGEGQGYPCWRHDMMMMIYIYIYIYIYKLKIIGIVDKSNTYNGFNGNISSFISKRT